MRLMPALALGLIVPVTGAALLAVPAGAARNEQQQAPQAPQLRPTPNFVKIYQDVDKAIKANDYATAKAKIAEAEAAASNDDDKYLLATLKLNIGLGTQDAAMQRAALEAMVASGKTTPADTAKFNFFIGQFALQAKEYDKAIEALNASVTGGYPDAGAANVYIAESYFGKAYMNVQGNQFTPAGKQLAIQGLGYLKKAIDAQKAAGTPVDKAWYSRGFNMASLSGAPDAAYWSGEALKNDPKPENWRIALRVYQDGHRTMTRDENLDLLRLMSATGALVEAYSYGEYVDAAMKGGLYGEAKSVIDKGRAGGHLQPTQLADLYKIASDGIAADRAGLPASEAAANRAPNGKVASSTGSAYLSYGDYAKAATLYRLALQKGGVDANEVNTRLGIALAQSGDMAGAKAAFAAVTGPGARKEIADFWTLWLTSKGA